MSNEPENRVVDAQVSETYRELAGERTPEHLNAQVLKMAAGPRSPYARARAWMRPAAWAATIALSFAIVLELTQLPSLDGEPVAILPSTDSSKSAEQNALADKTLLPVGTNAPDAPAAATAEQASAPVSAEHKRIAAQPAESLEIAPRAEIAARATSVMQEAEDLARAQAGSDNRADVRVTRREGAGSESESGIAEQMSPQLTRTRQEQAGRLAASKVSEEAHGAAALLADIDDAAPSEGACLESQRKAPDSWLDCIRDLRERGLEQQADEEYEEFQRLFPEFDDSITDK